MSKFQSPYIIITMVIVTNYFKGLICFELQLNVRKVIAIIVYFAMSFFETVFQTRPRLV